MLGLFKTEDSISAQYFFIFVLLKSTGCLDYLLQYVGCPRL